MRPASVRLTPQRFEIAASGELGPSPGTFEEAADGGPVVTGAYVTIYTRGADGSGGFRSTSGRPARSSPR